VESVSVSVADGPFRIPAPRGDRAVLDRGRAQVQDPAGVAAEVVCDHRPLHEKRALVADTCTVGSALISLHGHLDEGERAGVLDPAGAVLVQAAGDRQMRHADLARGDRQRRANTLCIQHRRRHALQHEVLPYREGAVTRTRDREDRARLRRIDRRLQAGTSTTVDRHLRRCQARRRGDQRRCHDARCSQPPTTASTQHPLPPIDPYRQYA
jgi:hypothetical protein